MTDVFIIAPGNKTGDKTEALGLDSNQKRILAAMRDNPEITKPQLAVLLGVGKATIDVGVALLKKRDSSRGWARIRPEVGK